MYVQVFFKAFHIIIAHSHRYTIRADMMTGLTSDFLRVFVVGSRSQSNG